MTNENEVVNTDVTNQSVQKSPSALEDIEQKKAEQEVKEEQPEPIPEDTGVEPDEPKAGDKTPPNALLKATQVEREKRRELEEKLAKREKDLQEMEEKFNSLTTSTSSEDDEVYSDEGKALQKHINSLQGELSTLKKEKELESVLNSTEGLKEHRAEFEEFLEDPDNRGMRLSTAAKAFIAEKGIGGQKRQGLENPTGGDKSAPTSGTMSAEDVGTLRKTNFRKYQDMLQKGQIKISK